MTRAVDLPGDIMSSIVAEFSNHASATHPAAAQPAAKRAITTRTPLLQGFGVDHVRAIQATAWIAVALCLVVLCAPALAQCGAIFLLAGAKPDGTPATL